MLGVDIPSVPACPTSQFCCCWLLLQPHCWKAQPFTMKLGTERHHLLPTLQGISWWLKLTSSPLVPSPALPREKKVDKCVEGWLGDCGLPSKEAIQPKGRVESWSRGIRFHNGPLAAEKSTVFTGESSSTSKLCLPENCSFYSNK